MTINYRRFRMCSLNDVIAFFLATPVDDDVSNAITPMKLQKLLYYAQGFSLALLNRELFKEDFEAWQYGPVIPSVYQKFKQYENGAIPSCPLSPSTLTKFTDDERQLLDDIYTAFGQYSAWALSEMTHKTPPWKNAKPKEIISKAKMKEYFLTQIEK